MLRFHTAYLISFLEITLLSLFIERIHLYQNCKLLLGGSLLLMTKLLFWDFIKKNIC